MLPPIMETEIPGAHFAGNWRQNRRAKGEVGIGLAGAEAMASMTEDEQGQRNPRRHENSRDFREK